MRKLIFERLLLHRFGSGTSQRTFFERAVSPSRSGATRLDGTVRIKMESVQNACRVDFYFKFPSVLEQYGDPAKMRGALCSFPYFQKSARRAAFYRKSAVPKEARFPQQRNRSGMGLSRFVGVFVFVSERKRQCLSTDHHHRSMPWPSRTRVRQQVQGDRYQSRTMESDKSENEP
jgi:hypothetical protein